MATKNINTVTSTSELASTDSIFISKGGSELQRIPYADLVDAVFGGFSATPGFHNGIYRGNNITKYLTDGTLWKRINGDDGFKVFEDLYLGDFVTVGSNSYVIVDFDYYIRCGNTSYLNAHHLVMMPSTYLTIPEGTVLYGSEDTLTLINTANAGVTVTNQETATTFKWNATMEAPNTNTTAGGYKYSRMRNVIMKAADTIVVNAFGDHVKQIQPLYPNPSSATASGLASNQGWFTNTDWSNVMRQSICDLPNETQIFGQQVWGRGSAYNNTGYEIGIDKFQFAIFAFRKNFSIPNRSNWWLRSVASEQSPTCSASGGFPNLTGSTAVAGVRPRFVLS